VMDESVLDDHGPRIEVYLEEVMAEFARREVAARGDRPPLELAGRTVLLVDNGARTGGTVRMSIRALRMLEPERVVVALPFAASETRAGLERAADAVVCLEWHSWSGTVAAGYHRFDVPDYQRIGEMLGSFGRETA
jgi:putative phosphoribosyl transferase